MNSFLPPNLPLCVARSYPKDQQNLSDCFHRFRFPGFLDVLDTGDLAPLLPSTTCDLSLDHTVAGTHGFDGIAVANVDAHMTVHPEEQSGDLRHGIHTAFLIAPLDHLLGGDVRHTVDGIADALGFGIEPAVTLDETNTVSSALAKPVCQNEVGVVANTFRVLSQLCFVVASGQHMTVGTPDIAPAGAVCFDCPLYQVQIVLDGGIVVIRVVDIGGAEVLSQTGEFLHCNVGPEFTVDRVDELGIRLILPEAGDQSGDEVGAA